MGEWRKSRRAPDRWGPQNRDSNWNWSHARPPRIPDELQVPRWEIEFCRFQGLPWHKLIEAKKFTHLYDNILKWDDAEGEKAFKDSKARFWARINGLESNIPIPGPDKYIDKVNHDEIIDSGIYDNICDAEGEVDFENVNKVEGESVIIWGDFFLTHQTGWSNSDLPVIPTGWGDLPDESNKPVIATGWGEIDNKINNNNSSNNNNNSNNNNRGKIIPTGWGDAEESWNMNQSNNYGNNYNNYNYNNNYNDDNNNYNNGYRWGNENYNGEYGNSSGWNKKRNNGDGNWNWNKDKRWRKKESVDKALFCAPVNGSTRYHDGFDMHRRTVT